MDLFFLEWHDETDNNNNKNNNSLSVKKVIIQLSVDHVVP